MFFPSVHLDDAHSLDDLVHDAYPRVRQGSTFGSNQQKQPSIEAVEGDEQKQYDQSDEAAHAQVLVTNVHGNARLNGSGDHVRANNQELNEGKHLCQE